MKTTSFILGLLLLSSSASAQIALGEQWRLSGFGTLSATRSDSDVPVFVHREIDEDWCFDCDTTLGLQLDWMINNRWRASVQAVKRPQGHFSDPELEWAYLESEWGAYSAKAGRLRLPIFMMSEYNYVSVAYPWIRPAHDVYDSLLGITHYDGAAFEWDKAMTDSAQLRLSTFMATPSDNDYRLYDTNYTLAADAAFGVTADWYQDENQFRFAYMTSEANLKAHSTNVDHYDLDLFALGINYSLSRYHLFSEFIYDRRLYANWYVGIARHVGPWQPYIQYGQRRKLNHNQSYLLGVRYNIAANVALNVEWQFIDSEKNSVNGHFTRMQNPLSSIENQVQIFSAAVSFTF